MKPRYRNEDEAVDRLTSNNISISKKTIFLKGMTGIKLWGAIDYLRRFGYVVEAK